MTRTWILTILIGSLFIPYARNVAQSPGKSLSADEIVERSDANRNGWHSYSVRTTIDNFEDGVLKDEGVFDVTIKEDSKTLVKFMNADVKGQYLLMVDNDMWIYLPNTRKPIRITPLQRLIGNASNGDVARTRYAVDYRAKVDRKEVVHGTPCYVLELVAKTDGATYNRIEYWVAENTYRPKKAEMYLSSGKHYKSITFDDYGDYQGRPLLTKMTITDRLRNGHTTIMKYESYGPKELPDKYFNKDYLEKLR